MLIATGNFLVQDRHLGQQRRHGRSCPRRGCYGRAICPRNGHRSIWHFPYGQGSCQKGYGTKKVWTYHQYLVHVWGGRQQNMRIGALPCGQRRRIAFRSMVVLSMTMGSANAFTKRPAAPLLITAKESTICSGGTARFWRSAACYGQKNRKNVEDDLILRARACILL